MLGSQVFLVTGYMHLHLNTNTNVLGTQLCSVTVAFDYMHHTHITHKGPLSHGALVPQPPANVTENPATQHHCCIWLHMSHANDA